MNRWLGILVVVIWVVIGGVWWASRDREIKIKLSSQINILEMEIKENDKFTQALAEIGLVGGGRGRLSKIEWIVTNEVQERMQVMRGEGVAYSMDFKKNLITGRLRINMQYSEEMLRKDKNELENMIERDMLAYVYLVKSGKWKKKERVKGLREALDWALGKTYRGRNWISIKK